MDIVYSTNPDFHFDDEPEEPVTLPPAQQKLHLRIERSGRGGKTVTVVENFVGTADDLADLCKMLKTKCGVGGSAKEGLIILQGDFRERAATILTAAGYKVSGNVRR